MIAFSWRYSSLRFGRFSTWSILVRPCWERLSLSRVEETGRRVRGETSVRAVSIRARERREEQRERPPPERSVTVEKRISMSSMVERSQGVLPVCISLRRRAGVRRVVGTRGGLEPPWWAFFLVDEDREVEEWVGEGGSWAGGDGERDMVVVWCLVVVVCYGREGIEFTKRAGFGRS